jgi:hypothetical protein
MRFPESAAVDSLPGRRGVRIAGALGLFVTALLLLTGLGLALTGHQVEGWVLVAKGEVPEDAGYERFSFGLLAEWASARDDPPPSVAALDGTRVETYGLARPAEGGSGLWLVADPVAVGEDWKPVIETSVWVEFPPGTSPSRPIGRGAFLRARGVLRVGLVDVPGVGPTACRLELAELWLRESEGGGEETCTSEDDDHRGHDH